jgi:large subunit ribosomal protein L9
MKVVLLKDVKGIGRRFEEKNVSDGHASNFLIPRKLALPANEAGQIKALKEGEAKQREAQSKKVEEAIAKISGTEVILKLKANEKAHLFASLNREKLSEILKKEKGIDIDPDYIVLAAPIKQIGTFEIPVIVGVGKETKFTLKIEAQ